MMIGLQLSDIIISTTVFGVVVFLLRTFSKKIETEGSLKHPPRLSILSIFRAILFGGSAALPKHFMKCAETLGPVTSFKIGKIHGIVLNNRDAIYDAFVKHADAFADRANLWIETKLNPDLKGIIFGHYTETWKKYHKVSLSILKEFGYGVSGVIETRILEQVEAMIQNIQMQNGKPFYPKSLLVKLTARAVMIIAFGREFLNLHENLMDEIEENATELVQNMDHAMNCAPFIRFLPVYRKRIETTIRVHNAMTNGIGKIIQFNTEKAFDITFIKRFIEIQGPNYNHDDLVFILRDLIYASSETVSTVLQWSVIELANRPEIQSKLQKEIDSVISGNRLPLPCLDDQPHLPYTQAFILEVFRRYTVVPFYVPHATVKNTQVLGYFVPKGCLVIPNAYGAQLDKNLWKDPENFIPERFLDKDNKIINSEKVIIFGIGKRSCFGEVLGRQQTFLFIVGLLRNFDIRPPENEKSLTVKAVISQTIVPSPFELRFLPRLKP